MVVNMKSIKYIFFFLFLIFLIKISSTQASEVLNSIENKTQSLILNVKTDKENNYVIQGEEIILYISSNRDCNIILVRVTTKGDFILLFPNKSHYSYDISSGTTYKIPGYNMKKITLDNSTGLEKIKVIGVMKEEFFEKIITPSDKEDYTKIEKPEEFSKKLQDSLKTLSRDGWATEEIEISLQKPETYVNNDVNTIIKENIDQSTHYYIQGSSYYEQGKYDEAIKEFKKFTEISPQTAFGHYSLGLSYQAKGAFKEAIQYYKKCINQKVKERDCYVRVGEIYDQTGDRKEACLRYKHALRITDGYEKINSINPEDTGKEKIYELEMKCKDNPSDKESRIELATIYEKLGNYKSEAYHLKILLSRAIPLYKPYNLEKDKPAIEKPVEEVQTPVYYQAEYYTYYEPYPAPYTPPPPPPVKDSPLNFDS